MRLNPTLLSMLCAVVLVSPCYAERRQDDANNGTRDDSLWSETESQTISGSDKYKCGISENAGKIRIDSKKGKGGFAAYKSAWIVDWTDSFVIEFEHELKSSRPTKTSQSATSGLALGFGTFDAASGWRDGVNVVVSRTRSARTVTATVRVGGVQVDSQTVNLATGAHDFKLVWTSFGGAVSMAVQLDGSTSPLLTLSGLESRFAARTAQGMGVSMFGTSAGNFKFEASFDDFSFSGDDYNDSDDSDFDDDDGDDDADEDGDNGGDDSTAAADFNAALDAIFVASNLPLLEAETDFQSGVSVVKALQWNAANGKLVQVVVNTYTGAILRNSASIPTAAQINKYEDSISVIGSIQLSATAAVSQALVSYPGATVHAIELEEEEGSPQWQVELVDASGFELEVRIWAN